MLYFLPKLKDQKIIVWFSCGLASAVAAKKTLEIYGKTNEVLVVNNPIIEEDADNQRFLKDAAQWLGVEILSATNSKYPNASAVEVWRSRRYMAGHYGAPCTLELKKNARYQFEQSHPCDYIVLGFTSEETKRHDRLFASERGDLLPVLIALGITKAGCREIVKRAGITPPILTLKGSTMPIALAAQKPPARLTGTW
jgi:hypothetical protein